MSHSGARSQIASRNGRNAGNASAREPRRSRSSLSTRNSFALEGSKLSLDLVNSLACFPNTLRAFPTKYQAAAAAASTMIGDGHASLTSDCSGRL